MLFHYKHTKDVVPLTMLVVQETIIADTPFTWAYAPTLEQANVDTKTNLLGYVGRFYLTMDSNDFEYANVFGYKVGYAFSNFNQEYDYSWTSSPASPNIMLVSDQASSVIYPEPVNINMYYAVTDYTVSYPVIP